MPFAGPRIIYQLIDYDAGDDSWMETWWRAVDYMNERLISFKFSDHESKKDQAVLAFHNPDFKLLDVPAFTRGQKYLISWGWPGRMGPPRRMIVVKVTGGNPLVVKMHDTVMLMDKKKEHRFNDKMTDSEFARMVAEAHGYKGPTVHIEETLVRHEITQPHSRTDARQLASLARRNGFIFYIDSTGLHWHSRSWKNEPVRTYFYRTDAGQGSIIDEPKFEANLSRGVSTIRVLGRDPLTKEQIDITVGPDTTDMISLGAEREDGEGAGLRADRVTREDVRPLGFVTRAEAEAEAHAIYRETAQNRYKLEMNVIGDGSIGGKQLIELYGVSDTVDGLWYLKEVEHTIVPGKYTCKFKGRKDTLREVKATKKAERTERRNKNANKNKAIDAASSQALDQLKRIRKRATMRYGPDGEPQIVWYYINDENEQVVEVLTPPEMRALGLRAREAIARESSTTQLPDR